MAMYFQQILAQATRSGEDKFGFVCFQALGAMAFAPPERKDPPLPVENGRIGAMS